MKIGLLSDVHANLEALTTVLRELERSAVERVICLTRPACSRRRARG
jgi:hypothetical protein